MIHHYLTDDTTGSHWAVGDNGTGSVLAQIQDRYGEQARVAMTPQQAREMAQALLQSAEFAQKLNEGFEQSMQGC